MEWNVEKLLNSLDLPYESEGSRHPLVRGANSLENASPKDLSFCSSLGEKGILQVRNSRAGVILCRKEMKGKVQPLDGQQTLLFADNPRLAFVKVLSLMQNRHVPSGISPRCSIDKSAEVGKNCYIGDFAVIGPGCKIGNNTAIYDRVSLVQNCIIGSNCIVQSGSSIGSDGFAFEREASGTLVRFPHSGSVRIGNNVEISANCSIARGSLSDTVIMDGTKLDALVHVAHNVTVGKNCELTAGTVIGGSTTLGDTCWTGLNSTLKNKISIGKNVIVASGASVIRDVADGDVVAGVPAKSIKHKVTTDEVFLMAGQEMRKKQTASAAGAAADSATA